ncbi:hypothetical protein YPPY14_4341, partial [Yersinia pestis PY-14]|jgi:hypothetical protein
MVRK